MIRDMRAVFVASLVGVAVVAAARGLWALRVVLALLFLAFILACAVRPGVEALRRRGIPRAVGLLLHYAAVAGSLTLVIWLLVPRALHQIRSALGDNPTDTLHHAARTAHGIKGAILRTLERALDALPPPHEWIHPAIAGTARAFHLLLGVAFVLGCATFWVLERDRARRYLLAFVPRE